MNPVTCSRSHCLSVVSSRALSRLWSRTAPLHGHNHGSRHLYSHGSNHCPGADAISTRSVVGTREMMTRRGLVTRSWNHVVRSGSVTCVRLASSDKPPVTKEKSPFPMMILSLLFCVGLAALSFIYSDYQKGVIEAKKKEETEKRKNERGSKGKPLIGGPFTLVTTDGKTMTDKDFLGQWVLIYFGFTFCPDICPEELEKIGEVLEVMDKTPSAPKLQPVFISVDPKRDTPELISEYLKDFHPRFIGLTGTTEQVKRATKAYRVYFSEGPDREEGANEYIVDHSIVTYLVDPKGVFSANFGQRTSPEEISGKIVEKINEFYMDQ